MCEPYTPLARRSRGESQCQYGVYLPCSYQGTLEHGVGRRLRHGAVVEPVEPCDGEGAAVAQRVLDDGALRSGRPPPRSLTWLFPDDNGASSYPALNPGDYHYRWSQSPLMV